MITFSSRPRPPRGHHSRSSTAGIAPPSQAEPQRDEPPGEVEALLEPAAARRGWHDSSMELRRGLDVVEDLPLDTLPAELRAGFASRKR